MFGRETHHSLQLFLKAGGQAPFLLSQSYAHQHMQCKNTALMAKTILLSIHDPKFSFFSFTAPISTAHPRTLISKAPRPLPRIHGDLSEIHKNNWEEGCAAIFVVRSCHAIMISAHYFYHPEHLCYERGSRRTLSYLNKPEKYKTHIRNDVCACVLSVCV